MKDYKIVVDILLGTGLLLVPVYLLTDNPILGVVGYTSLCLGNGLSLCKSISQIKKQKKEQNSTKDDSGC